MASKKHIDCSAKTLSKLSHNRRTTYAVVCLALLTFSSAVVAVDEATRKFEKATIQEIVSWPEEKIEASAEAWVELEATVYAFNETYRACFVGNDGAYLYVRYAFAEPLRPGDRVRIQGQAFPGHLNNIVVADNIEVLESGFSLNDAEVIEVDETEFLNRDCAWVKFENIHVSACVVEPQQTTLLCTKNKKQFTVTLADAIDNDSRICQLIDSKIDVAGNLGVTIQNGAVSGFMLNSLNEFLSIEHPSVSPLEFAPVSAISTMWEQDQTFEFRARGVVTYVSKNGMFFEDRSAGTWLTLRTPMSRVSPGSVIDAIGYRETGTIGSALDLRVCRVNGSGDLPSPGLVQADKLTADQHESRRVLTQGKLTSFSHRGGVAKLEMSANGKKFLVHIPSAVEKLSTLNLDTATHLTIAGTATFASHSSAGDADFRIYSPSFSDVEVTKRRTLWSNTKVLQGIGLASLVIGFSLFWTYKYRRSNARNERDLESLAAQLRSSFESIHDGIIIVDHDNKIVTANQMARAFFDVSLDMGFPCSEFEAKLATQLPSDDFISTWRRLNRDHSATTECEIEISLPTNRLLEVFTSPVKDTDGNAVARVWAFHDVTEKRRLQDSLLHSQKQEAIGRLAGGIAHDFNNLLTGITGNLFVARMDGSKTIEEMRESLDAADGASRRAAKLVSKLLGFSRKTRLDMQVANCNTILRRMEPLVRPSIPSNTDLEFQLANNLPNVLADPIQLEQVLLNICLNARDAIIESESASESGSILIKTWSEMVGDQMCAVVSIQDNGCGIPAELSDKVFEPFFTTKIGSGTGLGLAMSEGIVHQHNGTLQFETTPGEGTEFRVILPVTTQRDRFDQATQADVMSSLRGRRILVVEDDSIVRGVFVRMLESEKATTFSVSSGEEAKEFLSEVHGDEIEVVLLDWKMPGIGGKETLRWIKRSLPHIPVAICSGFVSNYDDMQLESNVAPDVVIQKPFLGPELMDALKRLLYTKERKQQAAG